MADREKDVVLYAAEAPIATITLNRPRYRNAQSYWLLDQLDAALDRAVAAEDIKVIVLRGAGGNFSSGHDLGTPEALAYRQELGIPDSGIGWYEAFRKYNLDITFKWRNLPKPTIALVEGFCIFGGWMIAASMDLIFAHKDALFLPALLEYASVPWDISPKKAKEICFESRFLPAAEAMELGFVNRVYDTVEELETETTNYALRVAENSRLGLRMTKVSINKAQDLQGYAAGMENGFADYLAMSLQRGATGRVEGVRRLGGVDLALRGLKGQRPGL